MIEPKMKVGFNCWVDDQAKPIAVEQQWEYLKQCVEITPGQLDTAITQYQIPILSAPVNRSQPKTKMVEGPNGIQMEAPVEPWKPRKTGDFNKVVMGCPALARFWEKDTDGQYKFEKTANHNGVPHSVRLASLTYALNTANGIDVLKDRWKTEKTNSMIEHAIGAGGYSPTTCRWLQDNGVCIKGNHPKIEGTHCFAKKPPTDIENGQVIVNPQNLPESEWNEPSPIRLAHEKPKMSVKELEDAFTVLFSHKERPDDHEVQFQSLMKAVKRLPLNEQTKITELLKRNKWATVKLIKQVEAEAAKEIKREIAQERLDRAGGDSLTRDSATFYIENGGYVRQLTDDKGVPRVKQLTNFTVRILEDMFELESAPDEDMASKSRANKDVWCRCALNLDNQDMVFDVKGDEWLKGADAFFSKLIQVGGSSIYGDRREWNDINYCVTQLGGKDKIVRTQTQDIGHAVLNKAPCYLMPSVIITKEGIVPNKEIEVRIDYPEARKIDFKILNDEEFKDLALHIVNDFFNCNVSIAAMTCFAHAMAAAIMPKLPISKSPLLFITGDQNCGKSFIGEAGQCFFGDFGDSFASSRSSGKGSHKLTHVFRHALVLCDDFKALIQHSGANTIVEYIQGVYDRSVYHALQRNGKFRDSPPSARGLSVITAQDVPEKEDSAISRLILIRIDDTRSINREKGDRVKERRKDYCGFTPHLIQFTYNLPQEHITETFKNYVKTFTRLAKAKNPEDDVEGSPRIAENLAMNMTAFHLAMECLYAKGVIDITRMEVLRRQHETSLDIIRRGLYKYVSSQKGVTVFLETIQDLLQDPARYHVANAPGIAYQEHKNSKPLGFYNPEHPDVFFFYTGPSYTAASGEMRQRNARLHPQSTIGKQLFSEGHLGQGLVDPSDPCCSKQVKSPTGTHPRTWAIKLSSLGFTLPTKKDTVTQTA
jgi:hypothetical protein